MDGEMENIWNRALLAYCKGELRNLPGKSENNKKYPQAE
jgi:hypothetical protein